MYVLSIFFGLLSLSIAKIELQKEEDVAILTKDNFDTAINEYDTALVMFYASWCGHCQALKPEFEKAAMELKKTMPNVLLAKVDAIAETELASQHGVKGYPTLKFHKNGRWIDYSGDRKSAGIISWITKKSGPAVRELLTVEDVEQFTKDANVVVGFIKDTETEALNVLKSVADKIDSFAFGLAQSDEIFKKFGINKNYEIVVFKTFDEPRTTYDGELSHAALEEFVNTESVQLVVEFDQETASSVFGSHIKKHHVSFVAKSGDYDKVMEMLRPSAKRFKGKMHFIIIDTDVDEHHRIMEFFGITKDEIPTHRIIHLHDEMLKFKPDNSDFAHESIVRFVEEVLEGKRKPFLMSQEIPPESDEPVRVLVGKNYNDVTKDESKAVFVKIYAPWCGHCQQLAPTWTSLGEAFKDRSDVIIAKFDATANEAEGLPVHSFPTLKFYPKGSKEAIDYNGKRDLEAFKAFVESNGKDVSAEESEDKKKKQQQEEPKDEL